MTKEEAFKQIEKNNCEFILNHPEWNNDKEIVLIAVQQDGWALQYVSENMKNDKEIAVLAIAQNPLLFQFLSYNLRKDKEIILEVSKNRTLESFSLLEGYQDFDEIVEREGEIFFLSCYNNVDNTIRVKVSNHPNFIPTAEQIEVGLNDKNVLVRQIYQLRKDEWLAKIEENKLRNIL